MTDCQLFDWQRLHFIHARAEAVYSKRINIFMKPSLGILIAAVSISGCLLCANAQELKGKKALFINSYHTGYAWSDGEEKAAQTTLEAAGVEVKVARMDTYRDKTPEHLAKVSLECKATIDDWKPDVVVVADDSVMKGVFQPFYKDTGVPFVFCGVNWTASAYGVPCKNITGMLEVCPVKDLISEMNAIKPGKVIGFLGSDTLTPKKDAEGCEKELGIKFETFFAKDFASWKKAFVDLQSKVDLLIIGPNQGIPDWNETEACKFAEENTKVPTGCWHDFLNGLAIVGFNKVASEQGEWAAQAAIKILKGATPNSIPIVSNKKGELVINAKIAKKSGITPSFEMMQNAKIIE
jgi:ABC-type uncharacterized transport system substrate-binding protein